MANIEANLDVMRRIGKRWKFVAELVYQCPLLKKSWF